MNENIKDKVVVITGASSGLGAATAKYLANKGAIIVLGARRREKIELIAHEIAATGGQVLAVPIDVTKSEDLERIVAMAVKKFKRIDVIINNAGIMPRAALEELKVDEWDQMIDVNIKGVLYGIAAVLPVFKVQKSGHIINVSSVAGHKISAGGAVYSATKFAVRALSEGLRQEVKPYNIRTTILSPGAINTELVNSSSGEQSRENLKKYYEQNAIDAEAFARTVAFAIGQPEEVDINEILFRPTRQVD